MKDRFVCVVTEAPASGHSLGLMLSLTGHPIAFFTDTDALLAFAELSKACAVISDIKNGGAVERDLARRLFERLPSLPLYVIANCIFTRGALLSAPANVTKIFDSPYSSEKLFEAISATCVCEDA